MEINPLKVMEFLRKEGKIANKQVQELLGVSHQAAYEILQGLVESKVIRQAGEGRATHYILS